MRRLYDLIVIGAEPAGLAAAACAARQGAQTALVRTGDKPPRSASSPGVPDFVWRKLDLHDTALRAKPISAHISLFADGEIFKTHGAVKETVHALDEQARDDAPLWADFQEELERAWRRGDELAHRPAPRAARAAPVLRTMAATDGAETIGAVTTSTIGLLDDYFSTDRLKTHLASIALSPFGLGGDEPGSVLALASLSEPASWRVRTSARGPSLARVLEECATAAGVEICDKRIESINCADDKVCILTLYDGEELRARRLMAASSEAAARAGLPVAPGFSPLVRREGAYADIRVRFSEPPVAPDGDKNAIYFLADSPQAFENARDAALEGRFDENAPLSFEFAGDEVIVHAPYCPAVLRTEGEARDWTEQDRQALGRQVVSRLAPFLNGATKTVRRVDVRILEASVREGDGGGVAAPPPSHDPIGAAARLALDLVSGE